MTSQEEMPPLHLSLCSLIRSFFATLTADQVLLLITGTPDETTKTLLADLISNIIQNLSTASLTYFRTVNAEVTKELVKSRLGNTVTDSFKAAMDVTARGQSRSAEALRDMISEEVLVSVRRSMSDAPEEHVPAPGRLDKMLTLVAKMIKAIKKKVFTPCTKGGDEPTTSSPLPLSAHAAESPEEVSEETPVEVFEETPEEVSEETPVEVFEETPVSTGDAPTVFEETPVEVFEETPVEVLSKSDPKRFWYDTSSSEDDGSEGPADSVNWMEVNFVPTVAVQEAVQEATPADPSLEETRRNTVLLVVEKLVSLTYSRSKVSHYLTDPTILIERLTERTWDAVEVADFDSFPHETVAGVEEAIFKDLVKKWGCAESVLINIRAGSTALEKFVADVIKARLVAPKEKERVRRLFSSVGRAIGGICKGSEVID